MACFDGRHLFEKTIILLMKIDLYEWRVLMDNTNLNNNQISNNNYLNGWHVLMEDIYFTLKRPNY